MQLWVRSGVRINLSFGFSRAVGTASDISNDKVLSQPINPVARQSDFREKNVVKKKRQRFPKLPPALPNSFTLLYVIHVLVKRILTPFPFKIRGKACVCGTPLSFRIDLPMSNC